jgi:Flp pilus assembly protein protease CpaA
MAALLIGYAVAIAIVFLASRPISINRPRTWPMERKMAKAGQLPRLMAVLLLGYFALTVAETFAFTFVR